MRMMLLMPVAMAWIVAGCTQAGGEGRQPVSNALPRANGGREMGRAPSDELVPYASPVVYPGNWEEIVRKRQGGQ